MNIHEYQAKQLLRQFGIPTTDGAAAFSAREAIEAAEQLPGPLWVVKAQIHAGGRGKGRFKEPSAGEKGGVRLAKSKDEVQEFAQQMLGNTLVTAQTGPGGRVVRRLYVQDGCTIARELYLSALVDRVTSRIAFIASQAGGMNIEEVAAKTPEKIVTVTIDPASGYSPFHGRRIAFALGLSGKQVGVCAKLIGNLSESLVNRFVAGMVVKIDAPTFEHRVAILKHRLVQMNREIADPVIEYVADKITSNVRELEGAVLKLLAFASISRQPITLALAQQALQEHLTKTAPIVRLSDIESVSAIFFGLSPGDLHTSRKTRTIALSRGVAMWLARKHTTMSYPEIGRLMGNKNHSTVILARAKMGRILQENGTVRWNTPTGEKQMSLLSIISEMEEQLGLPISTHQTAPVEQPTTAAPVVLTRTSPPTPMDANVVPAPQETVPATGAPSA